ncbi:MAG: hypothetical protein HC940_09095 [Acaryochloris sp. SU_5_25]|nr:hypothetical protein [Acaryochloris sp. SU_5_25]
MFSPQPSGSTLKPEYLAWMISLTILPLLIALLGQKQLFSCFLVIGDWCESLFQGIALPILDSSE